MKPRLLFALAAALALVAGSARAQMSESERKSAARAAFQEGVQLQDQGKAAEALARFEAAQKLFDAPTHQLHIAETQALTGKLVEANETYEALIHRQLPAGSPEAFVQAQQQAEAEQPALKARIPTLQVTVGSPAPSTLTDLRVTENGKQIPTELLGIARPVNPGSYSITATANGYATPGPSVVTLREKESKSVALALQPAATATPVVTPVPEPAPSTTAPVPAPYAEKPPSKAHDGSSPTGLLVGARLGAFVPGGSVSENRNFDDFATAGPGFGLDLSARLARMLLIGGTFELGSLGKPDSLAQKLPSGVKADFSAFTSYLGITAGIVPNIDRVSFIGDLGVGIRGVHHSITIHNPATGDSKADETLSGVEFAIRAGLSIPAGKIRIVPMAALNIGSFSNNNVDCSVASFSGCAASSGSIANTAGHTMFFVGLGGYFHADLGKKPAPKAASALPPGLAL